MYGSQVLVLQQSVGLVNLLLVVASTEVQKRRETNGEHAKLQQGPGVVKPKPFERVTSNPVPFL